MLLAQDHISEEVTWDTDSSLYHEGGEGEAKGEGNSAAQPGVPIQDILLPGYYDEWVKERKVRDALIDVILID